jgi:hypothetical protein
MRDTAPFVRWLDASVSDDSSERVPDGHDDG